MIEISNFEFYNSFLPLINNNYDAIPILISDDSNYFSRHLNKLEMKYVISSGYFSSKTDTLFLSGTTGNLKLILIKPSRKKRFLIGSRIACLPPGSYYIKSKLSEGLAFEVVLGFC